MEMGVVEIVKEFISKDSAVPEEERAELLAELSGSLLEVLDALDEALEEGLFEVAVSSSRILKERLAMFGLEELSIVAGKIEMAASSTSPLYLNCYYMRLRRELLPLLDYAKK
ncbi:phosphotransferase [Maridesulfovibrio sp.]|uniref:phosphotransferase n=1 Tax=Maridesulfovibrio sp. TaxID=2795000 RepID=UPI0029F5A07B|nr:phosphotransferase [Maridesulfovibrio sp.]